MFEKILKGKECIFWHQMKLRIYMLEFHINFQSINCRMKSAAALGAAFLNPIRPVLLE